MSTKTGHFATTTSSLPQIALDSLPTLPDDYCDKNAGTSTLSGDKKALVTLIAVGFVDRVELNKRLEATLQVHLRDKGSAMSLDETESYLEEERARLRAEFKETMRSEIQSRIMEVRNKAVSVNMEQDGNPVSCRVLTYPRTRLDTIEARPIGLPEEGRFETYYSHRMVTKDYPTMKVKNRSWKLHWRVCVADNIHRFSSNNPDDFQWINDFINKEVSHLCGDRACVAENHTECEEADTNKKRQICHMNALMRGVCLHATDATKKCITLPRTLTLRGYANM